MKDSDGINDIVLKFERTLFDTEQTWIDATIEVLDGAHEYCRTGSLLERGYPLQKAEHCYTRLASALTTVAANPKVKLTLLSLDAICRRKQLIAYIFNASGYRSMKHLVPLMAQPKDNGDWSIKRDRAAVLLAFLGIDDVTDELLGVALAQPQEILLRLMLGWLNQRAVLTAQGEKNRGRLLLSGPLISEVKINDRDIPMLINAWMYCSYASEPRKHQIKKAFNQLFETRMLEAGITTQVKQYKPKKRPKMMVIHERFISEHAMYRCFAPHLRSISKEFELIALADAMWIDENAKKLFKKVLTLESPRPSVSDIVDLVQAEKPDVIFYPSLGMSHWTVMLAGLRLAPVQIRSSGHPATSMWETIDYAHTFSLEGDPSLINSERVLIADDGGHFDAHTHLPEILPDLPEQSERECRIAVNSKVMKLSYRLIEICKLLESKATIPVKFVFLPGERGLLFDGLSAAIRAQLPRAEVMPYLTYERFITEICRCDFALAAFPFGNTNSTIDTCIAGLPTVVHFGPENPQQTDALVLRRAGLADWLVCKTDQDYFETALTLINDPGKRRDAMNGLSRREIRSALLNRSKEANLNPVGKLLKHVYDHHNEISQSGMSVVDWTEIRGRAHG